MTTRLVQSGAGCVRRAINGTNARTLKTTRIARMDPKSFTAVAGPTIRSRSAGILLHDPDRFENSLELEPGGVLEGFQNLTGIVLHKGYLYVAPRTSVERYKMTAGRLSPSGEPETIVTIDPETRHPDKGLAFDEGGSLYLNIGAPSNACQKKQRHQDGTWAGSMPSSREVRRDMESRFTSHIPTEK